MIRLVLLLSAGLFLTLQFAGRDGGKMRFGLIEAEKDAALLAAAEPEVVSQSTTTPQTVEVAFTPSARVVATVAEPAVQAAATPAGDLRYVSGRSVNVRSGPSTNDAVVDKVSRGDAVTVVSVEDNGWARIRVEGDGIDGYMSTDFLTEIAP